MSSYTTEEALKIKQMLKDLATLKMNHPPLELEVDDAIEYLKYILEFIADMVKKQS